MLQTQHHFGCSNRIYYACFYAVTALLLTKNLSSSKHSGVVALFNRHFIKTGIVSIEMGKFYSTIFDNRLESDYADWIEPQQSTTDDLEFAKQFVGKIVELTDVG